jgi:hypothetical protein
VRSHAALKLWAMSTDAVDPRALAAQRRGRIRTLRRRVAAGAVATFLVLWAVLFVQLATGHDPGLNDAATTSVVQSADPGATSTSAGDSAGASGSGDGAGWSDPSVDGGASPGPAVDSGAVTTRQS